MSKGGSRLTRLGVLAPAALSVCIDASVLAAPAAGAIVSTVLKELSKAFMLKKWFHGPMTALEAEQLLLQKGKSGSYLVRESQANPGDFVLSVRVRGRVRHVAIRAEQNKFDIGSGEIFDDLSGLIEHCREFPLTETSGEVLRLRQPVSGARGKLRAAIKDVAKEKIVTFKEMTPPEVPIPKVGMKADLLEIAHLTNKDGRSLIYEYEERHYDEYARIRAADGFIWFTNSEGRRPENRHKNRYREIVPYDQTRVVVPRNTLDDTSTDYINASYIRQQYMFGPIKKRLAESLNAEPVIGSNVEADAIRPNVTAAADCDQLAVFEQNDESATRREAQRVAGNVVDKFYVAAQGSLECTRHTFWAAIADNDVRVIAMLTQQVENGKRKCDKYWPSLGKEEWYGQLKVTNLSEIENEIYLMRHLQLYNKETQKQISVYQYQYGHWPDHRTPEDTNSILRFITDVNNRMKIVVHQSDAPKQNVLWVHCSAGIGRTGTFIAIDMLVDQIKYQLKHGDNKIHDVESVVKLLRWQRPGMVQNRKQYKFIHDACDDFSRNFPQEYNEQSNYSF